MKYKPVEVNFVCLLEFAFCKALAVPLQHSSTLPSTGALLVTTTAPTQQALQCSISFICFQWVFSPLKIKSNNNKKKQLKAEDKKGPDISYHYLGTLWGEKSMKTPKCCRLKPS